MAHGGPGGLGRSHCILKKKVKPPKSLSKKGKPVALIILDPAGIVKDETDGLLYFSAVYHFTEEVAGVIDGEIRVPVGSMSDSEVVAQLQAAAAAHANLGTGGDNFTPNDVRVYMRSGGLGENGATTLIGSEPDGIAFDFIDRTTIIKDTATPANDYSGVPTGRLIITRASTGNCLNSSGVQTLAGVNEARYDHHPGTLLPRGLLLESARTNLALQSEDAATSWTNSNITVTSNTGLGMRGTTTADKITATAANGTHTQAIAATAVPYTYSLWLRRITGTGNIDISADGVTWVTVPVTMTLTRFETTLTLTAATYDPGIRIVASGDEVEWWGAQFEAGGYASSYIQTTTIAVTRSADVASIAGTLFPLSQTVGTMILEVEYAGTVPASGAAQSAGIMLIGDGSGTERHRLSANNSSDESSLSTSDAVAQASVTIAGVVANTVYKIGAVYALNDFQHVRNGVLGTPDTSGSLPTTTTLYFGGNNAGSSANTAWYRRAMYLPRRVPDAELQALTA